MGTSQCPAIPGYGANVRVIAAVAALAIIIVAAILVLMGHRTLEAYDVGRDGRPQRMQIESPCSRWQDLFGGCEIPAGTS